MTENMNVIVEVWPVTADEIGIWLLSGGDGWRSAPVPSDSEPHFEVELMLHRHDVSGAALLHSTSWRPDGPHIVLTYVAVLHLPGLIREHWPIALPISADLLPTVGNPPPHGAAEIPVPRHIDVLHHALRHLRFLMDTDSSARAALVGHWPGHLKQMRPALAGMYDQAQQPVDLPAQS